MKKKVLIMTGTYIPGIKGGGPIQSIKNLVDNLSGEIDFYIITSDRDLGDSKPFDNVTLDKWTQVGNAKVFYTNKSTLSLSKTKQLLNSIEYDTLYLNSFFSYKFSIIPIFLRKMKLIKSYIVIAPRGEFNEGALRLKGTKKKLYLAFSKIINLYGNVKWHSTNSIEKDSIEMIFGQGSDIKMIKNLTADYSNYTYSKDIVKKPGELKVAYISRIHPMKNLLQSLEIIKNLTGKIKFNIYGPIEDEQYWDKCKSIINNMPANISVNYHGIIKNNEVHKVHQKNHIFLLLTLGENFGHAISEALMGGSPVIISDQTPWRELEKKQVGWDISLLEEKKIIEVLEHCVDMNNYQYNTLSQNAYEYTKKLSNQQNGIGEYIKLLSSNFK